MLKSNRPMLCTFNALAWGVMQPTLPEWSAAQLTSDDEFSITRAKRLWIESFQLKKNIPLQTEFEKFINL